MGTQVGRSQEKPHPQLLGHQRMASRSLLPSHQEVLVSSPPSHKPFLHFSLFCMIYSPTRLPFSFSHKCQGPAAITRREVGGGEKGAGGDTPPPTSLRRSRGPGPAPAVYSAVKKARVQLSLCSNVLCALEQVTCLLCDSLCSSLCREGDSKRVWGWAQVSAFLLRSPMILWTRVAPVLAQILVNPSL